MFKLFFVFCVLISIHSYSQVLISQESPLQNISREIVVGLDSVNKNNQDSIKLGYFNGYQWLKFKIKNTDNELVKKVLFLDSINGRIEAYLDSKKNKPDFVFGSSVPQQHQEIQSRFSTAFLNLPAHSEVEVFLRVSTRHNFNIRFFIGTLDEFKQFEKSKDIYFYIYFGAILALIFYNLIIYFYLKDKSYLRFCIFSFSFLLTLATVHGYLDSLSNMSTTSYSHYLMFFSGLTLFFATRFTYYFLEISTLKEIHKKIFSLISCIAIFFSVVCFTPLEDIYPKFFGTAIDIVIFSAELYYIILAVIYIRQIKSAQFYILSWSFVIVALCLWFGSTFGLISANVVTSNSLLFANVAQMLTLSLALSYRIHYLKQEKIIAEQKAIGKERYQRLLRVLSHDVSNSLTVIYTNTQKLVQFPNQSSEQKEKIQNKILFATENIKGILNQVKYQEAQDASRNKNVDLQVFSFLPLAEKSKLIFESDLSRKSIDLVLDIPAEINLCADLIIFLNNILCNLISNAIKFSYSESKIILRAFKKGQSVVIEVQDFGVGIDSEQIKAIYFSDQVVTSKGTQQEKGYGFGTSIIRDYVGLFDGQIEVESVSENDNKLNHGTIVRLVFSEVSN